MPARPRPRRGALRRPPRGRSGARGVAALSRATLPGPGNEGSDIATGVRRLHWGCGSITPEGWINSDIAAGEGVDLVCDIREGLPLEDESVDYAYSEHSLPELGIYEQLPALRELRRVLRPGGVLRLCLPDLDLAIDAYRGGRSEYFLIWDWETLAGNFITQMLWYGYTKTPFTHEFAAELLRKAGFREVRRVGFRRTLSEWPEITELDGRPAESFFVEAVR